MGVGGCRPSRESLSAGEVGCSPDEISISDENSSMNSETWIAVCAGRTFICSSSSASGIATNGKTVTPVVISDANISCHERLTDIAATERNIAKTAPVVARSAPPAVPAPSTGAGFLLGAGSEDTRQACETAGQNWTNAQKGRATCSGPAADLGFAADVAIKFCSGKACIITVHHQPESDWSSHFAEIKGKLTEKYGTPQESSAVVPAGCRTEADFVDCLTNKGVKLSFGWSWPTGERVILTIGKADPESDAAIRIDYTRPVRKVSANASAL